MSILTPDELAGIRRRVEVQTNASRLHGFEVRYQPFTGEAVTVPIAWCERCGQDDCWGCDPESGMVVAAWALVEYERGGTA